MVDRLKLKAKIVEAGYTQKTLAKSVGMSENSLSSKLNGKSSFDCDEAEKICAVLSLTDPIDKANIFFANPSQ